MNKSKCATMRGENPNVKWCITTFRDKRAQLRQIPCMVVSKEQNMIIIMIYKNIFYLFFHCRYLILMVLVELGTFDSDKWGVQENRNIWPQILPWVKMFPLRGEARREYIYLKYLPSCPRQVVSLCCYIHSKSYIKYHRWACGIYSSAMVMIILFHNVKDVVTVFE